MCYIRFAFSLCLMATVILATSPGQTFFDTMSTNSWVRMPVTHDTLRFPDGHKYYTAFPKQYHANITIDYKHRKLVHLGNETHQIYWGEGYFNIARVFDLDSLKWDISHYPDTFSNYTYKKIGQKGDTVWWVPTTTTEHPVASHVFDGARYCPALDEVLLAYNTGHTVFNYFHNATDSAFLTSTPVVRMQNSFWSYQTAAKTWTLRNTMDQRIPTLFSSSMIWDSRRNRMIGVDLDGGSWSRLYTLDPDSLKWRFVTGTGAFSCGSDHAMEYDPVQDKILIYASWNSGAFYEYGLAQNQFKRLDTVGQQPPKSAALTCYDTLNRCMVLVTSDSGTWAYASATQTWSNLNIRSPGGSGITFSMDYDPVTNVSFCLAPGPVIWALKLRPEGVVSEERVLQDARVPSLKAAPNPCNPSMVITLCNPFDKSLRGTPITFMDATGRLVRTITADASGRAVWNGRDDSGVPVATGVYVARAVLEGRAVQRTVVLSR